MRSALFFLIVCTAAVSAQPIEIETTSGWVRGQEKVSPWGGVVYFREVPYAPPPVDKGRFQASTPLRSTSGSRKVVNDLKGQSVSPGQGQTEGNFSEDCLKLSILQPSTAAAAAQSTALMPILVIVPGKNAEAYNSAALTAIGRIITVVVNYRHGLFSLVANENGTVEERGGVSDVLSALEWVWLNGEKFGGNLSAVTLAGVNGGAGLVVSALASDKFGIGPKSQPMPQQIILHGIQAPITQYGGSNSRANADFHALAHETACASSLFPEMLKCLRQISTQKLIDVSKRIKMAADYDSPLNGAVLERVELGKFPRSLKILMGENSGTGSNCNLQKVNDTLTSRSMTLSDLTLSIQEGLKRYFKTELDSALAQVVIHEYLFPGVAEKSLEETLAHFCSTLFSRAGSEVMARYLSRFLPSVFRYEFGHHQRSTEPRLLGAVAGDELPFLFPLNTTGMTPADLRAFQDLSGSWINFVRRGMPGRTLVSWPPFDEEEKEMMVFTKSGMDLGSSRFLDRDVHFWRDTFPTLRRSYSSCQGQGHVTSKQVDLGSPPSHSHTSTSVIVIITLSIGFMALAVIYILQRYRGRTIIFR